VVTTGQLSTTIGVIRPPLEATSVAPCATPSRVAVTEVQGEQGPRPPLLLEVLDAGCPGLASASSARSGTHPSPIPTRPDVTCAPVVVIRQTVAGVGGERLCMLDELGFPLSGPACSRRKGNTVPTARQWRQYDRDQADATILRRAATFLREDPGRARYAGLSCDQDAVALAALLDVLATEIAHLHSGVRWQAVESCRVVLGETMANPRIRRTRRR
jgi:hypothetical protein